MCAKWTKPILMGVIVCVVASITHADLIAYWPLDEGTGEVPENFGSVDEMAEIFNERPPWASWWPIRAAGWRDYRYQKD